ncbi:phage holin family protein [Marinobacter alexandrii]|uniref:phage holin family protein n=1 Tax=Marinobacter alexandrii TaxID=2570351 RepID=UPI001FFFD719|nr:phage holin family protein [Marinobacter alexandrii]MCK2149513.1 phage holin family protein [Marinobacter alexandrii]
MPEKWIAQFIARALEYWDAIFAIVFGIAGGLLHYLGEVKDGKERWSICAFLLAAMSSGFLSLMTYYVFVELFEWSANLSVAMSGIVAYVGAKNVELLLKFVLRKYP